MGAIVSIGLAIIAFTLFVGWALWRLIYDKKTYPEGTPTQKQLDPHELSDVAMSDEEIPDKETPATSQLNIPPTYFPGHTTSSGGSGGGSWSFQRRGKIRRRKRWPRLDD